VNAGSSSLRFSVLKDGACRVDGQVDGIGMRLAATARDGARAVLLPPCLGAIPPPSRDARGAGRTREARAAAPAAKPLADPIGDGAAACSAAGGLPRHGSTSDYGAAMMGETLDIGGDVHIRA
jgi:hypothetical protein